MQKSDSALFAAIISGLAEIFGAKATEAMITGYWMGLEDLTIQQVSIAASKAARCLRWFPKPVELRKLAGQIPADERAVLAWASVQNTIRRFGSYGSVDFDDPLINATIRNLGGWVQLCQKPTDEFEKWTRKDFERVYVSLCSSGTSAESCKYLGGTHETNNGGHGFEPPKPHLIETGLPKHQPGLIRELTQSREVLELAEGVKSA